MQKKIHLIYKSKFIDHNLKLSDKPYIWIYKNLNLINHKGKAIDTYIDSNKNKSGKLFLWNINNNINQKFIIKDKFIKTKNGNRFICYNNHLQFNSDMTNTISFKEIINTKLILPLIL